MYLGDPPAAKVIMFPRHATFDEHFAITFILGDPPNAQVIMFTPPYYFINYVGHPLEG